jgi:hypothetical protein
MAVQALPLAVAVAACVLDGRGFQPSIGPVDTIAVSAALMLMGPDFGLITMAVGVVTGRRGAAPGAGAGPAAGSYLLSSLASTISGIRPGRYLSLFSTGRPAMTRSAAGSAQPTSRSCSGSAWLSWLSWQPGLPPSAGLTSGNALVRNTRQGMLALASCCPGAASVAGPVATAVA